MSKIITICQNKGGVGKTTITANLGYLFAEKKKVLLVDTDSQANLSQYFNVYEKENILENYFNSRATLSPRVLNKNMSIIPNNIRFDRWKYGANNLINSRYFLRQYLEKVKDNYDFILIDTPPSLDISLDLSILASNYFLLIMEATPFAMEGLENILERINEIIKKADSGRYATPLLLPFLHILEDFIIA